MATEPKIISPRIVTSEIGLVYYNREHIIFTLGSIKCLQTKPCPHISYTKDLCITECLNNFRMYLN